MKCEKAILYKITMNSFPITLAFSILLKFNLEIKKKELLRISERENVKKWAEFIIESSNSLDILNFNYENFILHLKAIKENLERIPWKEKINDYLLYHYILPPRVTQEPLENFTWIYKDTLYNLVRNAKDIREAVLKINEWCYTKVEYIPTEIWDQNAISTIKRGLGRCEEMTILFMKALRTVCIPVREVYTPWWPFTESNHAWCEVWTGEKWEFIGSAEPTDLNFAWFRNPSKRAAVVFSPVFGKIKNKEKIFKESKRFTILNVTENYVYPYRVKVIAPKNTVISFCVYNYSALIPIFVDTLKEKEKEYILGRNNYFIYSSKGNLCDYKILRPKNNFDTVLIELGKKELRDTSFWFYVGEEIEDTEKPLYKPNFDSLNLIRSKNFEKISYLDTLKIRDKKLRKILENARGNKEKLLSFYNSLNEEEKKDFIDFFEDLNPKDLVMLDTINLRKELKYIRNSLNLAKEAPDTIVEKYLIPERILYEEFAFYRYLLYEEFKKYLDKDVNKVAKKVSDWVKRNIKEEKEREFFKPLLNPLYTYKLRRGRNIERYILICGILRSLGVPSKIKWNYRGVLYWYDGWNEISFEKEKVREKAVLITKFLREGRNVSKDFEYFDNYSIVSFKEYPERLEPEIIKRDTIHIVDLEKDVYYLISGFRNAKGDAFVRIKKVDLRKIDTLRTSLDVSIPHQDLKPGDMVIRKYKEFEGIENIGLKKEEFLKGKVIFLFVDFKSEESRSTVLNAKKKINEFEGKVFFFGEDKLEIEKFLRENNIKGEVFKVSKELINKWGIKSLPSILYLKENKPIFWIEGLTLHLGELLQIE
ncbi:MAG: transglutaminase domain-containing protein [Candidatus Hydrothermales bacterium]